MGRPIPDPPLPSLPELEVSYENDTVSVEAELSNPLFEASPATVYPQVLSNPRFAVEYSYTSVEVSAQSTKSKRVQWVDIDDGKPLTEQFTVGHWDRTPYIPRRRTIAPEQSSIVGMVALYGILVFLGACVIIDTLVLTA
mmetsp:Transcript_13343/g.53147  ORF Transcript_13343/g.53147 Transcript_13343/m.53147 type:complete len:140 (+) Transcript_13343:231-650(+)